LPHSYVLSTLESCMCYNTSAISINVSACTVYKNVKDKLISSEILKQTIQGATKHTMLT